jgi:DNA invertase Pin-like site-specific DNA recombinase
MLIGYMRVSKADGSQTTDPQRDALLEAGVDEEALYQDRASGKKTIARGWSRAQGRPRR